MNRLTIFDHIPAHQRCEVYTAFLLPPFLWRADPSSVTYKHNAQGEIIEAVIHAYIKVEK